MSDDAAGIVKRGRGRPRKVRPDPLAPPPPSSELAQEPTPAPQAPPQAAPPAAPAPAQAAPLAARPRTGLPPVALPPRARRHPLNTAIDEALIAELEEHLSQGLTRSQAAALLGISKQLLHDWIGRGNADLEAGALSLYAELSLAAERGRVAYEVSLLRLGNLSATDRNMNAAWIKWRLAQSSAEFRDTSSSRSSAEGASSTGFETVTPAEAVASIAAKLERFLAAAEIAAEAEAEINGG